jgi:DNA invertase Pin-like site-specific DNA recombinase
MLLHAGVEPEHLYVDDTTVSSHKGVESLKARAALVNDIRPGSRMIVTDMDRLGASMQDILLTIAAVTAKGAAVHDLSLGETFGESAIGRATVVAIEAEARQKRGRMSKARATLSGRKVRRGPKPKMVGATKEKARELYADLSISIRQVAEETGFSPTHLRRTFGNRETPTGRRPKTSPTS